MTDAMKADHEQKPTEGGAIRATWQPMAMQTGMLTDTHKDIHAGRAVCAQFSQNQCGFEN